MKFTETEVRITVSEVSYALTPSTNARQSTRHTPSVVAGPVRRLATITSRHSTMALYRMT